MFPYIFWTAVIMVGFAGLCFLTGVTTRNASVMAWALHMFACIVKLAVCLVLLFGCFFVLSVLGFFK